MTIDEILGAVLKDKPFYDTSGGGVTLSGGEPTLYMDFTSDLTRKLKEVDIHILIETCGYFEYHKFADILYPNVDTIYYDIKMLDSDDHRNLCGKGNERILKNFEILYRKYLDGGVEVLPRIPLIPGVTSTEPNLTSIASFLRKVGVEKIVLLPYNPLWKEKMDKLGEQSPFGSSESMKTWMKQEKISHCISLFDDFEIEGVNRTH
jgi:pyruvate formate lyase activating enzyme